MTYPENQDIGQWSVIIDLLQETLQASLRNSHFEFLRVALGIYGLL